MHRYALAFNETLPRQIKGAQGAHPFASGNEPFSREIYPEGVLWKHLAGCDLPLGVFDGFFASLARTRPPLDVRLEDPFTKLKRDFPTAGRRKQYPEYSCRG